MSQSPGLPRGCIYDSLLGEASETSALSRAKEREREKKKVGPLRAEVLRGCCAKGPHLGPLEPVSPPTDAQVLADKVGGSFFFVSPLKRVPRAARWFKSSKGDSAVKTIRMSEKLCCAKWAWNITAFLFMDNWFSECQLKLFIGRIIQFIFTTKTVIVGFKISMRWDFYEWTLQIHFSNEKKGLWNNNDRRRIGSFGKVQKITDDSYRRVIWDRSTQKNI